MGAEVSVGVSALGSEVSYLVGFLLVGPGANMASALSPYKKLRSIYISGVKITIFRLIYILGLLRRYEYSFLSTVSLY